MGDSLHLSSFITVIHTEGDGNAEVLSIKIKINHYIRKSANQFSFFMHTNISYSTF